MKKFIILLFFYSCINCPAQDIVGIDSTKNVKYGNSVQLKLFNVNTFIYNVEIKASNSGTSFTEGSALIKQYTIPQTTPPVNTQKDPDVLSHTNNDKINAFFNIPENSVDNKKLEEIKQKLEELRKLANEFYVSIEELKKVNSLYKDLFSLVQTDGLSYKEINEKKISFTQISIATYTSDEGLLSNELYTWCELKIEDANKKYYAIKQKLAETGDEAGSGAEEIKKNVDVNKQELDKADYNSLKMDLVKLFLSIKQSAFEVISQPFEANNDQIKFTIKKTPVNNKIGKTEEFEKTFNVSGGVKIDFSSGLFFSNIYDRDYLAVKDSVLQGENYVQGFKIIENSQGKIKPGLCALIHVYWNFNSWINVALNGGIGVGLTEGSQPVRYLAGASFILGKSRRIILNIGGSIGVVDMLRNDLSTESFYNNEPSINKIKKTKIGFYFGISYNLNL